MKGTMKQEHMTYLAVYLGMGIVYALYYGSRSSTSVQVNGVAVTASTGSQLSAMQYVKLVTLWPLVVVGVIS